MKQLKFEHDFAQAIIKGTRHTTLRIDDKGIRVGDIIELVDKVSSNKPQLWQVSGELHVVGVQEFRLADLPLDIVADAELETPDRQKIVEFLRRFYGDTISDDTVVKLISFTFSAYEKSLPYLIKTELALGEKPKKVFLYGDGGSRGNPGPSAAGFVIQDEFGTVLESWNKYLGMTTNNQAEYHALIAGLEWCKQHSIAEVEVRLDSLLVVNQMKGIYKVKNRDLWALYESAKKLQAGFKKIAFAHVPREMNKRADAEVNKALNAVKGNEILQ